MIIQILWLDNIIAYFKKYEVCKVTKKDFWCWFSLSFSTFQCWRGSQRTFCKCWRFCFWHILSLSQVMQNEKTSWGSSSWYLTISKAINHVSTRWLSLGKCLVRTLMQWELYFLSNFNLDDYPTGSDPESKYRKEVGKCIQTTC